MSRNVRRISASLHRRLPPIVAEERMVWFIHSVWVHDLLLGALGYIVVLRVRDTQRSCQMRSSGIHHSRPVLVAGSATVTRK